MDTSIAPKEDDARKTGTVRLGPISLFTYIAVLCLATLAVLSITTANASLKMAALQGESTAMQYEAESAAQSFVAQVCQPQGASVESVAAAAQAAQASTDGVVEVHASVNGSLVDAQFTCENGRILDIQIEPGQGGSYRVVKWNMSAKVNIAETETLWSGM